MAVSRKAVTEGIRTPIFLSTFDERSLTIPQSKIKDFCQLPLHKGAVGCSRTSAFIDSPSENDPKSLRTLETSAQGHREMRCPWALLFLNIPDLR